jgi:galactonate dehydratase
MLDGVVFAVPDGPGLGIEVDESLLTAASFAFWEAPHLRRRDGSVTNW